MICKRILTKTEKKVLRLFKTIPSCQIGIYPEDDAWAASRFQVFERLSKEGYLKMETGSWSGLHYFKLDKI